MAAPKGNKYALGNDGGRPKIGLEILWDGWYNDILELYSEGASDVEIRELIYRKTSKKTKASFNLWERWMQEEEEFCQTIKIGRMLSEAWWSKTGRKNLDNKEFSFTGWYMNMKNRFGWKDKQEIDQKTEHSGGIAINWTDPL